MRKMMWLIGLLVVANIVIFLMPHKEQHVAHVYEEQDNLNTDLVSLLNEEGQPIPEDKLQEVEDDPNQPPSAIRPKKAKSQKEAVCYRVGPFLQPTDVNLAQAMLDNVGVKYSQSKRESRRASVYRVYLGAWFDRKQLQAAKQLLLQNKVRDHFEKKQKDGSWIISLGIYLNQVSAKSEMKRFRQKGLSANIRNEQQLLPTNYWLNLDINDKNTSLIKDLSTMDWGSYTAKLVVTSCS